MMPAYPEARREARKAAGDVISYYPGCSLHATGVEFDI